jgi:hypothetical protein
MTIVHEVFLQAHMLARVYSDVLDVKLSGVQNSNSTIQELLLRVSGSGHLNKLPFEAFQEYAVILDLDGGS